LLRSKNPVSVKNARSLDKLSDIDYVFMLDGCALTDGILYYNSAFNTEGEIRKIVRVTPSINMLLEAAALYNMADSNSVSVGISLPNRFKTGIAQFISQGNVDVDALMIRCPIKSYSSATIVDPVDRVYYTDRGIGYVIEVSEDIGLIAKCSHSIVAGSEQPLSNVGADKIRHTVEMNCVSGKKVIVFTRCTMSPSGAIGNRCFIGAVVLAQRTDSASVKSISELTNRGVGVISFIPANQRMSVLDIPTAARLGTSAQKVDIVRDGKPITTGFGKIETYYGLNDFDICELICFAQGKGKRVAVIAFSDTYKNAIRAADLFITCADIDPRLGTASQSALDNSEISGEATSMTCAQTVKSQADILIRRPSAKKRGGFSALLGAFAASKAVKRNIGAYFTYAMSAQLLRICMVAIPMLFGKTVLDARHIVLCGFIIDLLVLLMFAVDRRPSGTRSTAYSCYSIKSYATQNKHLWISTVVAGIFAIAIPKVVDYLGFMGQYLYETEFLFCALLWMHPVILYFVKYGGIQNIAKAITDKLYLLLCGGILVFVALLHIIEPLGALMLVTTSPIAYFVLSFTPILAFAVSVALIELLINKMKK
jgi:hypothetical protein